MQTTQPSWKFCVAVPSSDQLCAFHARLSFFFLLFPLLQALNISSTGNATSLTIWTERHFSKRSQTPPYGREGSPESNIMCIASSHTRTQNIQRAGKAGQTFSELSFAFIFRFLDFISRTIGKVGLWKKVPVSLCCKMHDAGICKLQIDAATPCTLLLVLTIYAYNYFITSTFSILVL